MNRPTLSLASWALNVVLVIILITRWAPKHAASPAELTIPADPVLQQVPSPAPQSHDSTNPALDPLQHEPVNWSRFSTDQWELYRDELLATGCPRKTIEEILRPLVVRHYHALAAPLTAEMSARFWEQVILPDKQRFALWEPLLDKLEKELELVLGQLFPEKWATRTPDRLRDGTAEYRSGFLDPATAEQVLAALHERDAQLGELASLANMTLFQNRAAEIEQEFDNRIAQWMTPEEFSEWKARSTGASDWLLQLQGINLAQEELAELSRLNVVPDSFLQKHPGGKEQRERILQILGPERAKQFEQAADSNFQQLQELGRRTGYEAESMRQLWHQQLTLQTQAQQLLGDSNLSASDLAARLGALRIQAETAASQTFGPASDGFNSWKRLQDHWIREHFAPTRKLPLEAWLKEMKQP